MEKGKYNSSHFSLLLIQVTVNHNNNMTVIWFYCIHCHQKVFNICFNFNHLIKHVYSHKLSQFLFRNKNSLLLFYNENSGYLTFPNPPKLTEEKLLVFCIYLPINFNSKLTFFSMKFRDFHVHSQINKMLKEFFLKEVRISRAVKSSIKTRCVSYKVYSLFFKIHFDNHCF